MNGWLTAGVGILSAIFTLVGTLVAISGKNREIKSNEAVNLYKTLIEERDKLIGRIDALDLRIGVKDGIIEDRDKEIADLKVEVRARDYKIEVLERENLVMKTSSAIAPPKLP